LIVWERAFSSSDHDIHSRLLNAAGTGFTTTDRIDVANNVSFQAFPAVAAGQSNTALVVYEDSTAGNQDITARLFNGTAYDAPFQSPSGKFRFMMRRLQQVA
jgi:hypothetical protein